MSAAMMRTRIRIATIPPVPKIVKASIGSQPFSDSRSTRKLQRRRGCLPTGLRPRTTAEKRGSRLLRLRPKHHACTQRYKIHSSTVDPSGHQCQPRSRPPLTYPRRAQDTWNGRRQLRRLHPRIMRSAAPRCIAPTSGLEPRLQRSRFIPAILVVSVAPGNRGNGTKRSTLEPPCKP